MAGHEWIAKALREPCRKDSWDANCAIRCARFPRGSGQASLVNHPNLGFEQAGLWKHLTFRFGLDETSPTAGLSLKYSRLTLDTAYVRDMARSRVANLFGQHSDSFLVTLTWNYGPKKTPDPPKPKRAAWPIQ